MCTVWSETRTFLTSRCQDNTVAFDDITSHMHMSKHNILLHQGSDPRRGCILGICDIRKDIETNIIIMRVSPESV